MTNQYGMRARNTAPFLKTVTLYAIFRVLIVRNEGFAITIGREATKHKANFQNRNWHTLNGCRLGFSKIGSWRIGHNGAEKGFFG